MRTATLHVHQVVPRSKGGLSTLDNLLTLCEVCHPLVESGKKKKGAASRLPTSGGNKMV